MDSKALSDWKAKESRKRKTDKQRETRKLRRLEKIIGDGKGKISNTSANTNDAAVHAVVQTQAKKIRVQAEADVEDIKEPIEDYAIKSSQDLFSSSSESEEVNAVDAECVEIDLDAEYLAVVEACVANLGDVDAAAVYLLELEETVDTD